MKFPIMVSCGLCLKAEPIEGTDKVRCSLGKPSYPSYEPIWNPDSWHPCRKYKRDWTKGSMIVGGRL